jgi:hypothetical protein
MGEAVMSQDEKINPYAPANWTRKEEPREYWTRMAQLRTEEAQKKGANWKPTGLNAHYNEQEAATERKALREHVQSVAQTPHGGVWRGLTLPPGHPLREQARQLQINPEETNAPPER